MSEKLGVQNIKEVVELGLACSKLVVALSDGVQIRDLPPALAAARAVQPAVADADQLFLEYMDMDDEEAKQIEDLLVGLGIPDEKIDRVVKACLHVGLELRIVIQAIKTS